MKYIKRFAKAFTYPMFCLTGALTMSWLAVSGGLDESPVIPKFEIQLF